MPEIMNYDNLAVGKVISVPITVGASQTISRGDLLELKTTLTISVADAVGTPTLTTAESYVKPSGSANALSTYLIAAEDITTGAGETADTVGMIGEFNANSVVFGGSSTLAQNKDILLSKGIVLKISQ